MILRRMEVKNKFYFKRNKKRKKYKDKTKMGTKRNKKGKANLKYRDILINNKRFFKRQFTIVWLGRDTLMQIFPEIQGKVMPFSLVFKISFKC